MKTIYKHKASGGLYELLHFGMMQARDWYEQSDGAGIKYDYYPVDMREVVVYQSQDDGKIWVRPIEEWLDGRFEELHV